MNRSVLLIVFILLISIFAITGCQEQAQEPEITIPLPDDGFANVLGKVNTLHREVLEGIAVRLAGVYRTDSGEGVYALDIASSPFTETDQNGSFFFENIESGEYVLFIGDPITKHQVITDKNDEAKIWEIKPN
ncbi:MAG: hypothetical protein ACK2TV_15695 [Anaerolineales bacterium]